MIASPHRPARPFRLLAAVRAGGIALGLAVGLSGFTVAVGQPVPPPPASVTSSAGDPPGRVGRLAETTGPAWLFSPSQGEWVAAPLNRPLTSGDRIATDAGVRAVVRIGSTALRLDGGSELELVTVDDERIRVQLHGGSLAVRVRSAEKAAELQVLTGEGRLAFDRAGRYRVDRRDAATHVTVWSGEARFEGDRAGSVLYPRQRGEFWVDAREGRLVYSLTDPRDDAFTSWVASRDLQDERSASARYVSPEMTGAEELDRYGRWEEHGDYGALWIPRSVPPGWAPYRAGQWTWISPWGWTWVDDAPWGFAPSHYGRWVWWRESWAWAPGRWVARPVFAPALVAWIGSGGFSVGVQVGSPPLGWFPLGPRELYVPWYGVTPRYLQSINGTHVTQFDQWGQVVAAPGAWVGRYPYAYRWHEPAVTVVPAPQFGRQPVAPPPAGASRWIVEPSGRGDPGRGSGVIVDPGVRPGFSPPRAGYVPPRPAGLPPGVVEPDRRMGIPERMGRAPRAEPGGSVVPSPGAGAWSAPSAPAAVGVPVQPVAPVGEGRLPRGEPPGNAWSSRPQPGFAPAAQADDAARRIGRPPIEPRGEGRLPMPAPVQAAPSMQPMQPMQSAPAVQPAPFDDAARRIGRPEPRVMPPAGEGRLPMPAPVPQMAAPRPPPPPPVARPEPPSREPRVGGGRERDKEMAR